MYIFVEPSSKEDFYDYYQLRWLLLRRPLGGQRGSEQDHMEHLSIHRMIKNSKGECIGVGRIQLLSNEAQIRYMAILKKYQKKGLGSKLIKELEESIDSNILNKFFLNAREPAVSFYKKNGYEVIKRVQPSFGNIIHYRMEKYTNLNL